MVEKYTDPRCSWQQFIRCCSLQQFIPHCSQHQSILANVNAKCRFRLPYVTSWLWQFISRRSLHQFIPRCSWQQFIPCRSLQQFIPCYSLQQSIPRCSLLQTIPRCSQQQSIPHRSKQQSIPRKSISLSTTLTTWHRSWVEPPSPVTTPKLQNSSPGLEYDVPVEAVSKESEYKRVAEQVVKKFPFLESTIHPLVSLLLCN